MLLMASAAFASLLALPSLQFGTLKPDFKAAFNEGGSAAVQARLIISPNGSPIHCAPVFMNGPRSTGEEYCSMLRARTRHSPARDEAGQAAYGVIYLWSHWHKRRWRDNSVPTWNPPDMAIITNRNPDGVAEGSLFRLALKVDSTGKPMGPCAVLSQRKTSEDLTNLLCREATSKPLAPALDEGGSAVASVQEFIVRVTSQPWLDNIMEQLRTMERLQEQ